MSMLSRFGLSSKKKLRREKVLYLHVGLHKTGTTYIQDFLLKNRERLLEESILYPTTQYHPFGQQRLAYAFNNTVNPHLPPGWSRENKDVFDTLKLLLNEVPHNTLIVSSENLTPSGDLGVIKRVKSFFEDYNVKVILYVRRQDKYLQSLYREHIKLPNSETKKYKEFTPPYPLNYTQIISSWEKVFGKQNIKVKSYDLIVKSQQGLLHDFLATVGVNGDYPKPAKRLNETLPNIALELMRSANNLKLDHKERGSLNIKIREFCKFWGYNKIWDFDINPEIGLEKYESDNRLLSQTYFDGGPVFIYSSLDKSKKIAPKDIDKHLIFENLNTFLEKNKPNICCDISYLLNEMKREFEIQ